MTSYEVDITGVLNDTSSKSWLDQAMEPGPETVFVPVVWSLIIAVGVTTNAVVVYVVMLHMKMTTVTNYYIVNLALTDISYLLFCTPFTTLTFTLYGYLTEGMCRVISYVQQASVHATCMTLTIMSADRYFAIVYPIKSMKYRTRRLSFLINLSVWILSYIMAIPAPIFVEAESHFYYTGEKYFCFEAFSTPTKQAVYYTYVLVCTYILPLFVICACYSLLLRATWTRHHPSAQNSHRTRQNLLQKRRMTRMVLVVVCLFFVCWLPTHVFNCWERYSTHDFPYYSDAVYYARILAVTLAYSNSCLNPFVYAFMGNNFRTSFKKAFPFCFRRRIVMRNTFQLVNRLRRARLTEDGGTRVTVLAV
ncbi:G-protein coupled receptor 54-like [Asterias amurensis]|uniref:G-protein coupled receptor 54-like n=1 Tax=Asterias amurensis TaxID=7602 RepID=UPI003AB459C2